MAARQRRTRPEPEAGPGSHYFSERPEVQSAPRAVRAVLPGLELSLDTDRGVFAAGTVDVGTRELLQTAPPPPPEGNLLDLGAGYGLIAISLARRSPGAVIWAVDVNERALELVRRNVGRAAVTNVIPARPEEVPSEVRFRAIYSNPPVRVGKAPLHEMLEHWLDRMEPDGRCFLVVHKHLGSDSLARWLDGRGHTVKRLASRKGYRIFEVGPQNRPDPYNRA